MIMGVFSAPHLPGKFILFFLITAITHMAIILMNQPLQYWMAGPANTGIAFTGSPLETSPLEWVLFGTVYLALALFCLTVFNYRWSLIGWLAAEATHLYGIQGWLTNCSFGRWSTAAGKFCRDFDDRSFWLISSLILGLFITSSICHSPFMLKNRKVEWTLMRISPLLPAAWIVLLIFGTAASTHTPELYGWQPVNIEHRPYPLAEAEVAYDTENNELILFGGVAGYLEDRWDYKSDTWVWDGKEWHNLYPAIYPTGRTKHAMAYDENRGVIVLFGGYGENGVLEDTWEWDGYTWANLCTCTHPSARYAHEMFYDPARKKVILYGGYDGKTEFNDAWEWDGEECAWNEIKLGDNPPTASYFSLHRMPGRGDLLAMLSGWPGGTWKYNRDTWTQLSLHPEPGDRTRTTVVYDPGRKTFLLFGGQMQETNRNDTWLFDGANWSQFPTRIQPSIRSDMVIWYDPVRKNVMLFGGQNGKTYFDDVWEFIFPS
jgi:hypothetical protein